MILKKILTRIASEYSLDLKSIESTLFDFISEKCLKNEVMQKALNITSQEMEDLYSEAYQAYYADQYHEAECLFKWLALFNPFVVKYWMGYAASAQLLNSFEKALKGYSVASLLEPENPYPHFHAFECYAALKNEEDAAKALEDAYKLAAKHPSYSHLLTEIISLQGVKYA